MYSQPAHASRILAVPLLVALLWPGWKTGYLIAFGLYCLMGITDGYLARAQGTVSKLGQFLDPIADKIMIAAVILILTGKGMIEGIHVIAALIILLREVRCRACASFWRGCGSRSRCRSLPSGRPRSSWSPLARWC